MDTSYAIQQDVARKILQDPAAIAKFEGIIKSGVDPFEKSWDNWFYTEEAMAYCMYLEKRKEKRQMNESMLNSIAALDKAHSTERMNAIENNTKEILDKLHTLMVCYYPLICNKIMEQPKANKICGKTMEEWESEFRTRDILQGIKSIQMNLKPEALNRKTITTVQLLEFLKNTTILCGNTPMKCDSIKCVSESGSTWNPS